MKKNILFAVILTIFVISCVNQLNKKEIAPYFCNTVSDCEIKDVHNCCGYYPRCVNKDYTPNIEAVIKECQEKNIASVCGWPEITSCKCIQNTCKSVQGDSIV